MTTFLLEELRFDNVFQLVNCICFAYAILTVLCIQLIPIPYVTQHALYKRLFIIAITLVINLIFEVVFQACRFQWGDGANLWK